MKIIKKDLGINIPEDYDLIKSDSDPFGPPSDQEFTYIFKFDSLGYRELTANIENSKLFNAVSVGQFPSLPIDKKLKLIKLLSLSNMTSFWIKTDSNYVYDGSELFLNDRQHVISKAALKNSFLPNYDSTDFDQDGFTPRRIYSVRATVDLKKHTLYYHYVHP
jgi:hypothetical protein